MEKKTIQKTLTYTVLNDDDYSVDETSLLTKINDAKAKAQKSGDIKSTRFRINASESYREASGELIIQIEVERPENAEEFMKRTTMASKKAAAMAKNRALREERQRTKDLEQLKRLKAKYE